MITSQLNHRKLRIIKIAVGGTVLIGLGTARMLWNMRPRKMAIEANVDFERYLGKWYEIARKPTRLERRSAKNITFEYSNYIDGQFNIDLQYITKEGRLGQMYSEARLLNAPHNNGFSARYLPGFLSRLRKMHYNFIRIDADYQVALVGNRQRSQLWLLARQPNLDQRIVDDYLAYAAEQGFKLNDLIMTVHD